MAVVAGERSGDNLGAGLMTAFREQAPGSEFFGVAGEAMIAAGCDAWYDAEELSVMGVAEVLRHLPRLLRLRRALIERFQAARPDVFIGIDSPDFNLPLAAALKRNGLPTVQYVSPQVWAWRQSRVRHIRNSADLVLCLLPFEAGFYRSHGVKAVFVGHPLADAVPLTVDAEAARARLGIPPGRRVLAMLPGSRHGEVARLTQPFVETAGWLRQELGELEVVVALASERMRRLFDQVAPDGAQKLSALGVTGRVHDVLASADAVLTASGTASLEALLYKRPMAVAYRLAPLTYWLLRAMGVMKLPSFSLPNLLAGRRLVAEFLQHDVDAKHMGPVLKALLEAGPARAECYDAFTAIHQQLRCNANVQAARAVIDLLQPDREPQGDMDSADGRN